jgi:electron transport complex protein RnfG
MPEAVSFEAVKQPDAPDYYRALDKDKKIIGVVFMVSAQGYAGAINALAGMFKDGRISAIKIVSQNETPGLGGRVSEEDFTRRFAQKDIDQLAEVQAISGATVSSSAVIKAVEARAKEIAALSRLR